MFIFAVSTRARVGSRGRIGLRVRYVAAGDDDFGRFWPFFAVLAVLAVLTISAILAISRALGAPLLALRCPRARETSCI